MPVFLLRMLAHWSKLSPSWWEDGALIALQRGIMVGNASWVQLTTARTTMLGNNCIFILDLNAGNRETLKGLTGAICAWTTSQVSTSLHLAGGSLGRSLINAWTTVQYKQCIAHSQGNSLADTNVKLGQDLGLVQLGSVSYEVVELVRSWESWRGWGDVQICSFYYLLMWCYCVVDNSK